MEIREIIKFSKEINRDAFYHALQIYLRKPQVVNRRLNCSTNLLFVKLDCKENFIEKFGTKFLKTANVSEEIEKEIRNRAIEHSFETHETLSCADSNTQFISCDKITSKNNTVCFQTCWIDTSVNRASFYSVDSSTKALPSIDYAIQYESNQLKLLVNAEDFESKSCGWLRFVLLKKISNWIENYDDQGDGSERIESHSLINSEEYSQLYACLKEKYGRALESIWTDEATDPKKFIYEDIAICAYLISFWKEQRKESGSMEKQSFCDFGCGNGLLVYLLNQEGYRGYGIDLRKRKIWDKYQPQCDLRESTWTPDSECSFGNVDWIIGNHSDELSPWVPVVAYRSSFTCNYFLLPCCAYQFSGAKFQRQGASKSLYMSFIDFLKDISSVCGFQSTLIDRLKIPSTKRICLIGLNRAHEKEKFHEQCAVINDFISKSNDQQKQFVPREKIQIVRNCTKTDKNLVEKIVKIIFEALMKEEKFCAEYGDWNCGSELMVADAVNLISKEDLNKLKSECGGLQTLLKNKHQIFEIYGGRIKIRKPKRIATDTKMREKARRRNVIKTSPCYFHLHHKQGCFLKDEDCCYQH